MSALRIPTSLPATTRTWLAYIDAECDARAAAEHTTKLDQANRLIARATGSTAHFARVYAAHLEAAVRS